MQSSFDAAPQLANQWPDFYSLLNSSPETDADTLRKNINKMYVQANTQLDHRELERRFYYQVLSQKVLPQCRRVLLDSEARQAYDEQWILHRNGAMGALSYREFIMGIAKNSAADAATLLSDSELAILPSFENQGGSVSVAASLDQPSDTMSVSDGTGGNETSLSASPLGGSSAATAVSPPVPKAGAKKPPLLLGGLAALGVALAIGAVMSSSHQSEDPSSSPSVAAKTSALPKGPMALALPIRVVAGATDPVGGFVPDKSVRGGSINSNPSGPIDVNVPDAAPEAVYQSERYGPDFSFRFPVPANGHYTVRLHFAEIFASKPGVRRENIDLNGTRVLSDFCIATMAGQNKAMVKEYKNVAPDAGGNIVVRVSAVPGSTDQNAKISAIEILKS